VPLSPSPFSPSPRAMAHHELPLPAPRPPPAPASRTPPRGSTQPPRCAPAEIPLTSRGASPWGRSRSHAGQREPEQGPRAPLPCSGGGARGVPVVLQRRSSRCGMAAELLRRAGRVGMRRGAPELHLASPAAMALKLSSRRGGDGGLELGRRRRARALSPVSRARWRSGSDGPPSSVAAVQ
jgi:hypothetical protein